MNYRQLPPLNALRAFECAARHLSVKIAAEELCVTSGAVSQMIKLLEEHLGVKLFKRMNRRILLTQAGQDYLPVIRNAFRQIAEASRHATMSTSTGILTLSVTPFFASAWLIPRLNSFGQTHPDIDLQVLTGNVLVDFSLDNVDIAVRHGVGRYPGLRSHHLVSIQMVPVAAPSLVARLGMPASAADLLAWPKVNDADRQGWRLWFQAQGVEHIEPARGTAVDNTGLLLNAVIAGHGAGLLPAAMVAPDIEQGRLVQLAKPTHMETFAYYLVYPQMHEDNPKIAAFRDWILGEASA